MTLIEREAYELARENCSADPPRPCATCLERARVLLDGCTAMDGSPIGPRGAVEALREIKRVAAIEAPPVSDEVPAKVWKLAFDALNALGGQ